MSRLNKYFSIGYVIYLIVFAFFSLLFWKYANLTSKVTQLPKFIFYYATLGLPSIFLLVWKLFKSESRYKVTITDYAFLAFIIWNIASIWYSINTAYAFNGVFFRINLFLIFINLKWIFQEFPNKPNVFIANTLLVLGFYFIADYFYSNANLLSGLINEGTNYQAVVRRLSSLLGTKNVTAMFMGLVFMFHFSFSAFVKKNNWIHVVFQCLALFLLLVIGSRNVYVSLIVFSIILLLLRKGKIKKKTIKHIVLLCSVILIYFVIINNEAFLNHLKYNTLSNRINMWEKAIELTSEKPIQGYGTYQYLVFKPYFRAGNVGQPHNDFIRIAFENGILGLFLFVSILIIPLIRGFISLRNTEEKEKHHLIGLMATMLGYISLCTLDGLQFEVSHQLIFVFILAKLDVISILNLNEKPKENSRNLVAIILICTSLVLGISNLVYCHLFLKNHKTHTKGRKLANRNKNSQASELLKSVNTIYYFDRAHNPVNTRLGIISRKSEEYSQAEESLKMALLQYPFNYNTIMELHTCALEQDNDDQAIDYLIAQIEINPIPVRDYLKSLDNKTSKRILSLLEKKLNKKLFQLVIKAN